MNLTYNGYQFSDRSNLEMDVEVVYDDSGRTVAEQRIKLTVRSTIVPEMVGTGTDCLDNDRTIQEIRRKLSESGKSLVLEDAGFDLRVNAGTDSRDDIDHGPKPEMIRWVPIASKAAAAIVWTCTITVGPCRNDSPSGLKALTYSIGFSINQKGFTTKTVRGVIQSVSGVSADDLRDRIVVERSTNSHRDQDYNLSQDRTRLEFTITDKEIESPNSYPAGVVSISAPFRVNVPFPNNKVVGKNSLNVNMELEATTPRTRAWEIFVSIFRGRIARYLENGEAIVVTSLTITEDWYSHEYDFSVQFTVTTSFNRLLLGSGLFQAFPVNWTTWSESVASAQRSRGQGQFKYSTAGQGDKEVSLCETDSDVVETVALEATEYFRGADTYAILCNETPPPPDRSWLKYDAETVEATQYNRKHISTYGTETKLIKDFNPSSATNGTAMTVTSDSSSSQSLADGVSGQYWIWKGHALRVGYPIPDFGKTRVGETDVEVIGDPRIRRKLLGFLFCQPVYEVAWSVGLVAVETPAPSPNEGDPTITNSDYSLGEDGQPLTGDSNISVDPAGDGNA